MVTQQQRAVLRTIQVVCLVWAIVVACATIYLRRRLDRLAAHLDELNKALVEENAKLRLKAAPTASSSTSTIHPKVTP